MSEKSSILRICFHHMTKRFTASFLLLVFLSCFSLIAYGVKPMKHLEVLATSEGVVVFAKPSKIPCIGGNTKNLEFDLTLSTLSDSVSFTCTVIGESQLQIDNIRFSYTTPLSTDSIFGCCAELIYAEPKGDKWAYRLRALLSYDEFNSIVESGNSPVVTISPYSFQLRPSAWRDRRIIFRTATEIINQNKK